MCYFLQSVDGSSNLQETIVFFCACVTFVVLSNAVISSQWMMPFIYVVLAPVLFGSRIVSFWYVAYILPYYTISIRTGRPSVPVSLKVTVTGMHFCFWIECLQSSHSILDRLFTIDPQSTHTKISLRFKIVDHVIIIDL